jgi:hypothetical protein
MTAMLHRLQPVLGSNKLDWPYSLTIYSTTTRPLSGHDWLSWTTA